MKTDIYFEIGLDEVDTVTRVCYARFEGNYT